MTTEDESWIIISPDYGSARKRYSLTNEDLFKLASEEGNMIYGPRLFALKYRILPCIATGKIGYTSAFTVGERLSGNRKQSGLYHATSILHFLIHEYKLNFADFLREWNYDAINHYSVISNMYVDLGNYISVKFSGGSINQTNIHNPNNLQADAKNNTFNCFDDIEIHHTPEAIQHVMTLFEQLSKLKVFPITESTFQMVCQDSHGNFHTSSVQIKKPHIPDLKLHYGDDFQDIHDQLIQTLQKKDSTGITFLHGPPGTGKTSYLRYLISEIKGKLLIYVPPDLVNQITQPSFLPFLMRNPNSILIIEDAENIIRDRTHDQFLPKQAVANLLNLSDGLLGDAMHQQIICTFNCDIQGVDPALMRDGRLVVEYKFDKLSAHDARRICKELQIPGNGDDIQHPITLADIYAKKNGSIKTSNNVLQNGHTNIKNKQKEDTLFGLYS